MCFTMQKSRDPAQPTKLRRRLTANAQNAGHSIIQLTRAISLGFFPSPTVIHLGNRADIYLSAAIQKHLRKTYDACRNGQPLVTREQFQKFLDGTQGEAMPKLTEQKYTFEKFLELLWLDFGVDAMKPSPAAEKDLSWPMSNYFINSSHNTYLWGFQLLTKGTTNAYRRVLQKGCRCVEIDVWDGDKPLPTGDQVQGNRPPSHRRGFSGSSIHSAAAQVKGTVSREIEKRREKRGMPKQHSHSPRCSQFDSFATLQPAGTKTSSDIDQLSVKSRSFPRHEPIVMHGYYDYQLTEPVGFREVCQTIREEAFKSTNLPLIVSLEVHARAEQQEVMVQIMKQEWKDLLVDAPLDGLPKHQMPRLCDLQRKILIKVKKSASLGESTNSSLMLPPGSPGLNDDGSISDGERPAPPTTRKTKICDALGSLGIYTHSEHFDKFEAASSKVASHIYSLSEKQIIDLYTTKHKEMFAHNRNFFMRAYPKSMRVDSSNPDPASCWRKGVQMVALNWQSCDEGMMLNTGMFAGEDGWVLKPAGYRSTDACISQYDAIPAKTLELFITVFAGQHIPLPEDMKPKHTKHFRPFVKCELHVEKPEERPSEAMDADFRPREIDYKQRIDHGKTDHPEFLQNNILRFQSIPGVVEDLSFVRFKVEDDSQRWSFQRDGVAAWACIRLSRLQTGYRFIDLYDMQGNKTEGKLFVLVQKHLR
ncbi:PLC-like phosphodiesterase [Microdochium trichocladiopsis]|uniref:Phosphoinositide phospholipase C n=1 Tax=Microdochium trichocladiopsis TaxID=1682393 RepID=A0A9P9BU96_9PEZI|nr:PLC-like phosphodiesterase [Microdochium trichocladiopsis]KAH7037391.1 PLC-like phosphodiesterase [Microdochium trichocladiopsis]